MKTKIVLLRQRPVPENQLNRMLGTVQAFGKIAELLFASQEFVEKKSRALEIRARTDVSAAGEAILRCAIVNCPSLGAPIGNTPIFLFGVSSDGNIHSRSFDRPERLQDVADSAVQMILSGRQTAVVA